MPMTPAVRASDLVLAYGSEVAVSASTFEVPAGKVTAVIGPNGSGKSTLLNAIAGLMAPVAGSLEVAARSKRNRRISYVIQSTKTSDALPVTVDEVVAMGRYTAGRRRLDPEDRRRIEESMERVGLTGLAGRHLSDLSGGERQRVFVAQGLAQDHDLLLLDEPLTGIDLPTARAIDTVIHDEIARGCTIVLTTHDLSEASVADHVVLTAGRVVAAGPPDEVLVPEYLATAYGSALLHVEEGRVFFDDPAHQVAAPPAD